LIRKRRRRKPRRSHGEVEEKGMAMAEGIERLDQVPDDEPAEKSQPGRDKPGGMRMREGGEKKCHGDARRRRGDFDPGGWEMSRAARILGIGEAGKGAARVMGGGEEA